MDKNAIKKFAIWARRELIERVSQRAAIYGITAEDHGDPEAESINGRLLSSSERNQRKILISNIEEKGFEQVIEEVAYTWFNRFAALRFMEVNGYLPSHVRVFTNDAGEFKPQILTEAIHLELDGLNMDKVYELENANKTEELFKYLLVVQCNALNSILPGMFQRIDDYTELLLPDNLLREGSVIEQLVTTIPENNFDVNTESGQIEIIGWLYQYYISEKHEKVVDPLHGKVVKKEEVPAATQLFTTDWVVRYLIDNTVGRYWIERNPNSTLAEHLTYFIKPKNGCVKAVDEQISPADVTTFDPCVGSGHFLIYAFDVLIKIYTECGYSEREAAAEIVKNNLYGLDIDARATQLAYFSIMMKARQYDKRFFTRGIRPNIHDIKESNNVDKACVEYFCSDDIAIKKSIEQILESFKDAKEYGSILQIPVVDFEKINIRFKQIENEREIYTDYLLGDFQLMLRVAEVLSQKYAVVATNPPYLNKYDILLKSFILQNYKKYSGDLFSVFVYRNFMFCKTNGYSGFMTPFVWMFIKTYEDLRNFIINEKELTSLIQMEYSAYEEATVPICSFICMNGKNRGNGYYFRLSDFKGGMEVQRNKVLEALNTPNCDYYFESNQENFSKIPGSPIAYWISPKIILCYDSPKIYDLARPCKGIDTGDNNLFLRLWPEVDVSKLYIPSNIEPNDNDFSTKKWFPYNKGGDFRKWYGNNEYVIDWSDNGQKLSNFRKSNLRNKDVYFKKGITWSTVTSGNNSFRFFNPGYLFDNGGSCLYTSEDLEYIQGFLNSVVCEEFLSMQPTINTQPGTIGTLPLIESSLSAKIDDMVLMCRKISKEDWDSFETSWDFNNHPFVCDCSLLKNAYEKWENNCNFRFESLRQHETCINRIFIDIYSLQTELSPEVEDNDITVRKADLSRDIRSFISYAVGCMFGRYSLDVPGLVYAGGTWDPSKYTTFPADEDAILPICDDEYFEDDIVGLFISFVEKVYGKETLEENLQFIADALGGKGTSREIIRNYFINGFYADHVKVYQKRPIYWLFDSGKKNGFKCLIYLHRYKPDTIARIRTDYIHEQQSRYRTAIEDLNQRINGATASEKVKLGKKLTQVQEQAEELRIYEEKIHHLADQMIEIDLDDGVKVNYAKFQDVLAKIK